MLQLNPSWMKVDWLAIELEGLAGPLPFYDRAAPISDCLGVLGSAWLCLGPQLSAAGHNGVLQACHEHLGHLHIRPVW